MRTTKRRIRMLETGGRSYSDVYDEHLNRTKKLIFKLILGLASALKVSPKILASSLKDTDKYAKEFSDELKKQAAEEDEKLRTALKESAPK